MARELYIALGMINPNCITMANDALFTKGVANINKSQIATIEQVFLDLTVPGMENLRAKYRYPYIMKIMIKMTAANEDYVFECQTVINQPTWRDVTNSTTAQASLNKAENDISTFL